MVQEVVSELESLELLESELESDVESLVESDVESLVESDVESELVSLVEVESLVESGLVPVPAFAALDGAGIASHATGVSAGAAPTRSTRTRNPVAVTESAAPAHKAWPPVLTAHVNTRGGAAKTLGKTTVPKPP